MPFLLKASDVDLPVPDLKQSYFEAFSTSGWNLLFYGLHHYHFRHAVWFVAIRKD